jgi:23S rRNA pseudouridine2605 synthase
MSGFEGERIAKVMARAGLCSRREAERLIADGRVSLNGEVLTSVAVNVTSRDSIAVNGKALPRREETRLWRYHKPQGLVVSHRDPQGRPTVFEKVKDRLPRVVSVGRLDINTEGLLLLTNDGALARFLELPASGWLRRYRVRAYGQVDESKLAALVHGIEIDGVRYGSIQANVERAQGDNRWLSFAIREGKNREIKKLCEHLGLKVNRLIRVSFGPLDLGELRRGEIEEVPPSVLRKALGNSFLKRNNADRRRQVQRP